MGNKITNSLVQDLLNLAKLKFTNIAQLFVVAMNLNQTQKESQCLPRSSKMKFQYLITDKLSQRILIKDTFGRNNVLYMRLGVLLMSITNTVCMKNVTI